MLIRERKCCGRIGSNDMVTNEPMTRRHPVSQEHNTVPRSEGKMLEVHPGEVALSGSSYFFLGPVCAKPVKELRRSNPKV